MAACADPAAPGFTVRGGFLRDPEGRAVILRGVNLSGRHKAPPYFDYHGPADFVRLRADWGLNAVRFLITWAAVEPEDGRFDDAYLAAVADRLAWADAAGLLVIIDMHQDLYGEGFGPPVGDGAPRWTCADERYQDFTPRSPWFLGYTDENVRACFDRLWSDRAERLVAAWAHVAERLAAAPAVIGFDIINEPHWGSADIRAFEPDVLTPVYARVIDAVRARAPHWIPFVEPSSARNLGVSFATRLGKVAGPLVYAPHAYDPLAESGTGFDPTRAADLAFNIMSLAEEAHGLLPEGAALVLGEYGGVARLPGIHAYMDTVYDAAGAVAAGSFYWHYGRDDGYGLLDAEGHEKPELMSAIARPYPARIAGDPVSYAYDEEKRRLTVAYHPDRSLDAATVILGPGGKEVAITHPPPSSGADPATIEVTWPAP